MTTDLIFLHFNDVYHIDKPTLIARFLTQLRSWRAEHAESEPYTIFSGDVFSPSLEASILRGDHMVELLREIEIDVGCLGNHDFDFGEQRLKELKEKTKMEWLLSNAMSLNGGGRGRDGAELLAGAKMWHTAVLQGYKVGFLGLAGSDWPSNCKGLPECCIVSPVEAARAVSRHLRRVEKCDFVIAVTHMRLAEDLLVSEALRDPEDDARVDLLLGGHDHDLLRRYEGEGSYDDPTVIEARNPNSEVVIGNTGMTRDANGAIRIVKSGSDWKSLSRVRLQVSRSTTGEATLHNISVAQVANMNKLALDSESLSSSLIQVNGALRHVHEHISTFTSHALFLSNTPLEGTSSIVRSRETNLGNFLADAVRAYYDVDIALVNSGSIRCDRLIPSTTNADQPLTVRDMIDILPFNNALVVKRIPSPVILSALENSVSDAHTDGRFCHFSGLSIFADWSAPENSRVLSAMFHPGCGNSPVKISRHVQQTFTVAMVGFIADGFDGYGCFTSCDTLVGEEGAMTDTELLLRVLGYERREQNMDGDEAGIERARKMVVKEWVGDLRLPVIRPAVEGRIRFVDHKVTSCKL
ncbi:Metallo-dependent phosphatase [Periconia macrospinosa]|uniref:Metallo-dependent phosphatase n=1 Tax=Periconia macrospinosa TaxID=97972 RepID=A0A2V1D7C2_9PLEO|nr:Metallo-dependent phosphatase [Periconia macrospinosa]